MLARVMIFFFFFFIYFSTNFSAKKSCDRNIKFCGTVN